MKYLLLVSYFFLFMIYTPQLQAQCVPPTISEQPEDQSVCAGSTATFTVSVDSSSTPPLSYQWAKNGTDIPGATSDSYTTPATTNADDGAQFRVKITNACGSVNSATATLNVDQLIRIFEQPEDRIRCEGEQVIFSVSAFGSNISYQWYMNGTPIPGETSSGYITTASLSNNGSTYKVTLTNACGTVTSNSATLTVYSPSTITSQPTNQAVCVGATATFSVIATSTTPLTYQWSKNGVSIAGATSSTYTTPSTTTADNGATFSVKVTNFCGDVTSNNATLTVNSPVTITTQPASITLCAGSTATFSVNASGTAPLTYQWIKNGLDISGATSSSYTTPPTTTADNGATFSVKVTNFCGTISSNNATLTVNSPPTITSQPTFQTVCVGSTATFSVTSSGAASYQWKKNGSDIPGATAATYTTPATVSADSGSIYTVVITSPTGCTTTSNAASLTVNSPPTIITQPVNQTVCAGITANFSVTASGATSYQWKKNDSDISGATAPSYTTPATVPGDNGSIYTVVITSPFGCTTTSNAASLTVNSPPTITTQPANQTVCSGLSVSFSVTATGTGLSYQWLFNGTPISGATASTYTIPSVTTADSGSYNVQISNTCGAVNSFVATLTVNSPPAITTQPANQTVCVGSTATFSVVATGTATLTYQWFKNGSSISSATLSTYTTPPATPADDGAIFNVQVTNPCGVVTSTFAILTVHLSPTITTQPANQAACIGSTATFSVDAPGTGLSYQWVKDGNPISGATSSTYIINPVTSGDSGTYLVVVTNTCGSISSNTATLTINPAPAITTQPADQTICAGSAATFSVNATGAGPLSYQWSKNGEPIAGATTDTLTIPSAASSDSGLYTVVVTNACGSVTSNSATLSINRLPAITAQPTNQTACIGQTATFTVIATGEAPLSYQWFKNDAPISDATAPTYTTPSITQEDGGALFHVVVKNACGSTTSTNASLSIKGISFTFTTVVTSPTSENGTNGSIVFIVSEEGPFLYSINDGASFETSDTFLGLIEGTYNLVVKGECGIKTCQVILYPPLLAAAKVNTPLTGPSLGSDIISFTQPAEGSVIVHPDGTYLYQPENCFSGNDSFTYTIANPCGQTTNTVLLVVSFWASAIEDPYDPIYNPFPERTLSDDYYPCVIFNQFEKGHFSYRMWHQGPKGIALSESQDGIHWNFVKNTNLKGKHPCVVFNEKGFKNHRYQYAIWFWTGEVGSNVGAIQYSFSTDGVHWLEPQPITESTAKPLVFGIPGTPFHQTFGPGFVAFNPNAKPVKGNPYTFPFLMFYDISSGSPILPGNPSRGAKSIGLAYSKNGIHWKRHGSQPILNPSENPTDWDSTNVFRPSLIQVEGTYHLFYSGSNDTIDPATTVPYAHGLGHASSADGINWTKDPANPIFIYSNGVEWRNSRSYTPFVLYDDFDRNNTSSSCSSESSCSSCSSCSSHSSCEERPKCLAKFLKMWFGGGMGTSVGKNQGIGFATWPCCKRPRIVPLPPAEFIGSIKRFKSPLRSKFLLTAIWEASPSPDVKSYRIFKKKKIVATIAANQPFRFKAAVSSRKPHYEIAAVNIENIQSILVPLRIVDE